MPVIRYHSSRYQALLGNGLALEAPASSCPTSPFSCPDSSGGDGNSIDELSVSLSVNRHNLYQDNTITFLFTHFSIMYSPAEAEKA